MKQFKMLLISLMFSLLVVNLLAACGATTPPEPAPAPAESSEETASEPAAAEPATETESEAAAEPAEAAAPAEVKVAMVLPGSISDRGFNQSAYEGLQRIEKELGVEVAYSESTPIAEFEQVYLDFIDQGFNVIIGHGFQFGDVATKLAAEYPDVTFIVDNNPVVNGPNLAGIAPKTWESAYLLGVLAGLTTETNKIGGIAGFDFPVIVAQMEGYRMGAQAVNPDIEVNNIYIGSMEDVAKAKEAAFAQISAGADVIFHIADAAGIGVIQAAAEEDVWAIGWGLDQSDVAPENVLSSLLLRNDELLVQDIQKLLDGTWTGEVRLYGLDTGVVGIAPVNEAVPAEVAEQVEQVRAQLLAGEIDVPYVTEPADGSAPAAAAETEAEAAAPVTDLRVAMVLPGPISDKGFNQGGYAGLELIASELGAETAFSESTPIAEFEQVYRDFADQGFNVIIGHGFEFGDVALKVAPDYPDTKFIVGSHPFVAAENVAGITGETWQSAYVLGALAGLMTESNKIGGIAGFDFPIIVSQMEAYKLGAQSVNPDVEVTNVYIGTFDDAAKAKEAAFAQISAGADVIFHIADAAGVAVVQAAEEEGVWAIGWGLDQNSLAPKTVISSLLFGNDDLYLQDVEKIADGTWTGEARTYGLATGVVGIADFYGLVPNEVAEQIEQIKQEIIDGTIEVPYITEPTE